MTKIETRTRKGLLNENRLGRITCVPTNFYIHFFQQLRLSQKNSLIGLKICLNSLPQFKQLIYEMNVRGVNLTN